jgi:hypothetical protein
VFDSATVDTNVLLVRNTKNTNSLLACHMADDFTKQTVLHEYVTKHAVPLKHISSDTWFIGSLVELSLKQKIEMVGVPLKEWDVHINYGIKTGLNEAFIVDTATRDRLVAEDPKSAEILKPILRGRDIKRYSYEWAGLWLIASGFDIDVPNEYPAVYRHLLSFEDKAKKRDDQGKNWWNLRSCAYYDDFENEKIVWPDIMREPLGKGKNNRDFPYFYFDRVGFYQEATNFFMTGKHLLLIIAILNSKAGVYFFTNWYAGPKFDNKGFRYKKVYLENFLLPKITEDNTGLIKRIENTTDQIVEVKKQDSTLDTSVLEREIDELVMDLYQLTDEEKEIIRKS